MGIDAQRSGASELPDRAVEVRRAQGATTKAIPVWIVEEEQRSDRPHSGPCNLRQTDEGRAQQDPCALRVAAARGAICVVGGPRRCTPTSPAGRRLASGPAALATRPSVLSPRTPSPMQSRSGWTKPALGLLVLALALEPSRAGTGQTPAKALAYGGPTL